MIIVPLDLFSHATQASWLSSNPFTHVTLVHTYDYNSCRYYHVEELQKEAHIHTLALVFLQKVVKGFVARKKYRVLVTAKRKQDKVVESMFATCEQRGDDVAAKANALMVLDARLHKERSDWLEEVARRAAQAEAEAKAQEEERQRLLAEAEKMPLKEKTKLVDGAYMWRRNEHLTLRVGKLPKGWSKKFDEETERWYFKNHDTQETTWIDPRSASYRKADPLDCADDELPYGWDEGETEEGQKFYIDHVNEKYSWVHPRVVAERLRDTKAKTDENSASERERKMAIVRQLRSKKVRLQTQLMMATNDRDRQVAEKRVAALDEAIMREMKDIEGVAIAMRIFLSIMGSHAALSDSELAEKYGRRWREKVRSRFGKF